MGTRDYSCGVLLLLLVLANTYAEEPPTPRVYDKAPMFALAVRIRSKILQPFGLGDELLKDMRSYNKELEDLTKDVNEESPEARNAFDRLKNQGGPLHLHLRPVDTKRLSEFYKWNQDMIKMFQDIFEQTLHQWNDLNVIAGLVENKDKAGSTEDSSNF